MMGCDRAMEACVAITIMWMPFLLCLRAVQWGMHLLHSLLCLVWKRAGLVPSTSIMLLQSFLSALLGLPGLAVAVHNLLFRHICLSLLISSAHGMVWCTRHGFSPGVLNAGFLNLGCQCPEPLVGALLPKIMETTPLLSTVNLSLLKAQLVDTMTPSPVVCSCVEPHATVMLWYLLPMHTVRSQLASSLLLFAATEIKRHILQFPNAPIRPLFDRKISGNQRREPRSLGSASAFGRPFQSSGSETSDPACDA